MDKGIYRYHIDTKTVDPQRLLPDYYISFYLEDSEGNLWLGTFKKGLLRIPNQALLDFRNNDFVNKNKPMALSAGGGDTLYALTGEGQLYLVDEQNAVTPLALAKKDPQNRLQYVAASQRLYFNDTYYDLEKKQFVPIVTVAIKSTQVIPPNNLLLGDYTGILLYSTDEKPATLQKELDNYEFLFAPVKVENKPETINLGRISEAHYQASGQRFWIGASSQLFVLEKGDTTKLTHHQQPIVALSVTSWNDTAYVATADEILVFAGTTYTETLKAGNVPLLHKIRRIEQRDGRLYVMSSEGFQCIDLITKTAHTLTLSDGLLSNKILDFALLEHCCYLLTSQGLQKIPYELLKQPLAPLKAVFESIYVDQQLVDKELVGNFAYYQNELEANFDLYYLRDRSQVVYQYRLLGVDKKWIQLPVGQHQIRYNALGAGHYQLQLQALDKKRWTAPIAYYSFYIALPFWQTWWFISLCIVGVVLLVSLFFLLRIRLLKQQNKLLLDKKAIEKQLVESQQSALRSQMNPHFLFNALNSIQEMIMINDKKSASNYLGKFADLMRLYLNQSREESITLAEELEALTLYLELEQVRFEDSLTIKLEVSPTLSPDVFTLPPMLIQPYVENAFKHGLLHLSTNRHLYIGFVLEEKEQLLCCTIRDNGVGRATSGRIKHAQKVHHSSFASSATQRRLELLNYNKKKLITATIKDLTNEAGHAVGTEVNLCIPLDWEVE